MMSLCIQQPRICKPPRLSNYKVLRKSQSVSKSPWKPLLHHWNTKGKIFLIYAETSSLSTENCCTPRSRLQSDCNSSLLNKVLHPSIHTSFEIFHVIMIIPNTHIPFIIGKRGLESQENSVPVSSLHQSCDLRVHSLVIQSYL